MTTGKFFHKPHPFTVLFGLSGTSLATFLSFMLAKNSVRGCSLATPEKINTSIHSSTQATSAGGRLRPAVAHGREHRGGHLSLRKPKTGENIGKHERHLGDTCSYLERPVIGTKKVF